MVQRNYFLYTHFHHHSMDRDANDPQPPQPPQEVQRQPSLVPFTTDRIGESSEDISDLNCLLEPNDNNSLRNSLYTPRSTQFADLLSPLDPPGSIRPLKSLASLGSFSSLTSLESQGSISSLNTLPLHNYSYPITPSHPTNTREERRQKIVDRERSIRAKKQRVMRTLKSYYPLSKTAKSPKTKVTDIQVLEWCSDVVVCVMEHPTDCQCRYAASSNSVPVATTPAHTEQRATLRRNDVDSYSENRISAASI